MRSINTWIDSFIRKHPRFGIPDLMKYIVIIHAVVYMLDSFSNGTLSFMLMFHPGAIMSGQIWRLITFIFVPSVSTSILFTVLSLYFYYMVGTALEREWGSPRFTMFYAFGVVCNIIVGLILGIFYPNSFTASTTYINLSLFFAFATLFPNMQFLLFFIIPVKAKWLAWFNAAFFGWSILKSLLALNWVGVILPIIAILNYFIFFSDDIAYLTGRIKHKTSKQTINFKAAQKHAKEKKGYLHKCAVCGKTDTDYPNLEFRYCSKCNGYYCYCMEHINNHVHVE